MLGLTASPYRLDGGVIFGGKDTQFDVLSYNVPLSELFDGGFLTRPVTLPVTPVDMKGVNPDLLAQDWADCESYSEQIVMGKGVAKGAAVGAGVGAIGGAINDDIGRGAANGALIGATKSGLDADRDKQQVFKRCLRGRGYKVLN